MYILKINQKAFVIKNDEIIITSDYTKASRYETIGEAMRMAASVNNVLGKCIVSIINGNFD
jgi:hypothetical protein